MLNDLMFWHTLFDGLIQVRTRETMQSERRQQASNRCLCWCWLGAQRYRSEIYSRIAFIMNADRITWTSRKSHCRWKPITWPCPMWHIGSAVNWWYVSLNCMSAGLRRSSSSRSILVFEGTEELSGCYTMVQVKCILADSQTCSWDCWW